MARFSELWRPAPSSREGKGGRLLDYVNRKTGEIKPYGAALTEYRGMSTHAYARLLDTKAGRELHAGYTKANNGQQGLGLSLRSLRDASSPKGRRETAEERATRLMALAAFKRRPDQSEEEWLEENYPDLA